MWRVGDDARHGLTLGELGNLFVRMDDLKQVVYSVVKVEGLRRKDSMRTMLRAGYASSFPFASPNMPTWNSALYFPAFVVLEATNVRYLASALRSFLRFLFPYHGRRLHSLMVRVVKAEAPRFPSSWWERPIWTPRAASGT